MKGVINWLVVMLGETVKVIIITLVLLALVLAFSRVFELAPGCCEKVCPDKDGWVKIDSGDYAPVEGACEYCFKAGHWEPISYYPEGGFGQEGSCNNGIEYCDLSHWSYKMCDPTPTDTPQEPSRTPTSTFTPEPSATPTFTPEPTLEPSRTPKPSPIPTRCQPMSCGKG